MAADGAGQHDGRRRQRDLLARLSPGRPIHFRRAETVGAARMTADVAMSGRAPDASGPVIPSENVRPWHQAIAPELRAAFEEVLAGPKFTMGPFLRAFEHDFAAFCGARSCIGISSGTAALHLSLLALGVGPGDEVITVPNTYVATAFAITYTGATPVFVDVDPVTYNMDPAAVQ